MNQFSGRRSSRSRVSQSLVAKDVQPYVWAPRPRSGSLPSGFERVPGDRDSVSKNGDDRTPPIEVRSLSRTLKRWRNELIAWHKLHNTNEATEATNDPAKRVKHAFGLRHRSHPSRQLCGQADVGTT